MLLETEKEVLEKSPVKVLSATDAAYIAGFMDGEGSFFCNREKSKFNRHPYYYNFTVTVSNTNVQVLQWIMDVCGGTFWFNESRSGNANHKTCYKIVFSGETIRAIVPQFIDYLIIKKKVASLVLNALKIRDEGSNNYSHSKEEIYHEIYCELRELNARGNKQLYIPFEPARAAIKKETQFCSYPGCTKVHYGNGFCKKHYNWDKENPSNFNKYEQRKCANCGCDMLPDKYISAKTCSEECKKQYDHNKVKQKRIESYEATGFSVGVCQVCGVQFSGKPVNTKYCSEKCRSASRNQGLLDVSCLNCGKVFKAERKTRMFCENKCFQRFHAKKKKMDSSLFENS